MSVPFLLSFFDTEKSCIFARFLQTGPVVQWIERKFPKL